VIGREVGRGGEEARADARAVSAHIFTIAPGLFYRSRASPLRRAPLVGEASVLGVKARQ